MLKRTFLIILIIFFIVVGFSITVVSAQDSVNNNDLSESDIIFSNSIYIENVNPEQVAVNYNMKFYSNEDNFEDLQRQINESVLEELAQDLNNEVFQVDGEHVQMVGNDNLEVDEKENYYSIEEINIRNSPFKGYILTYYNLKLPRDEDNEIFLIGPSEELHQSERPVYIFSQTISEETDLISIIEEKTGHNINSERTLNEYNIFYQGDAGYNSNTLEFQEPGHLASTSQVYNDTFYIASFSDTGDEMPTMQERKIERQIEYVNEERTINDVFLNFWTFLILTFLITMSLILVFIIIRTVRNILNEYNNEK